MQPDGRWLRYLRCLRIGAVDPRQRLARRLRLYCLLERASPHKPADPVLERQMKIPRASAFIFAAGTLAAASAMAQTTPSQKQQIQDGNSPTMVGPGSAASKQRTQDGNSPTMVGPGSAAYKQRTQDGNSPTMVGPGSAASKQRTQDGNSPTMVGPGSAAYKQRTQDGNSPTMVGPGSAAYKQRYSGWKQSHHGRTW